jgi:hypothetical protein
MTLGDGIGHAESIRLSLALPCSSIRQSRSRRLAMRRGARKSRLHCLQLSAMRHGAIEAHEYFSRRVVTLFPERWTITRSRIVAHINMIEAEKRALL